MTSEIKHRSPIDTVKAWFAHRRAGELDKAVGCWAPDALWRIQGSSSRAKNYSPPDYVAMLTEWFQTYPAYTGELSEPSQVGELVYFTAKSRNGEAPGESEGMAIFRVVDGLIAEGWAIPGNHGGRMAF